MNQQNFEYLKDQVKYTGFGDGLEKDLKEQLQKQAPEFQLTYRIKMGQDTAAASLHFKKSNESDRYFFNRYQLALNSESGSDKLEQTFYINKGQPITLKEAYNLMSGRAVNKDLLNKEGQVYNAWLQLDFKQTDAQGNYKLKQFHQNYGFDLPAALNKLPIKELSQEPDRTRLLESLQKGNRQAVTFIQEGNEQKHYIEANPQFKTLNIYDSNLHRLNRKPELGEKETPAQMARQEAQKASQHQDLERNNDSPSPDLKRGKKNGHTLSKKQESLWQQKRPYPVFLQQLPRTRALALPILVCMRPWCNAGRSMVLKIQSLYSGMS